MAVADNLEHSLFLLLLAGLSSCAPSGITFDASVYLSLKGDSYWTWSQTLELDCSSWIAKESWASVQLVVDTQFGNGHRQSWQFASA